MKKRILIILGILTLIGIVYFGIYFIQNIQITKSLEEYNKKKLDNEHALVRCNWNIFKPEFAYVYFDENISFDSVNKIFWSPEDWENSYTGGTTVQNTTFPQLLEMVKEDCGQFKTGSKEIKEKGMVITYTKVKKKSEEEIKREEEEEKELERMIKNGEIKIDTRTIEEIKADRERERLKSKN